MNPVLYLIYHFLKSIVRLSLRIFYRRTDVRGRDRLASPGPLIVLTNHPSTVMDPFNAVARVKNEVYFLANASLFKHPLADRILSTLYCIRVERYQDVNDRPLQNDEAFSRSIEFLAGKGTLYIAPEGTSEVERRLRKIKTGTARIALAAEAAHDFGLNLRILPVGLNYSDPTLFRADLLVDTGPAIPVSAFADLYRKDQWAAVEALTEAIRNGLSERIVDTAGEQEDELLRGLEAIAQTEAPLPFRDQPARSRKLLLWLRDSTTKTSDLRAYAQFLERNRIRDADIAGRNIKIRELIVFFLGLPLAVFGWINHLLPCGLPGLINRRFNRWPCYDATYKYVSGLVFFPLFYFLQIRLVVAWLAGLGWWYALLLPLSGLWADHSIRFAGRLQAARRWKKFQIEYPDLSLRFPDLRANCLRQMEGLV